MDQAQVALKLMLDTLGMPANIRTVKERKAVQKAVYLGQAAGVDLGYRYNWYVMGPYAPSLTRDYFGLAEAINDGDDESPRYELQTQIRESLNGVRPLLVVPADVELEQADWLELLASLHFLLKRRRLSIEGAQTVIREEKAHVAPFLPSGVKALQDNSLI